MHDQKGHFQSTSIFFHNRPLLKQVSFKYKLLTLGVNLQQGSTMAPSGLDPSPELIYPPIPVLK